MRGSIFGASAILLLAACSSRPGPFPPDLSTRDVATVSMDLPGDGSGDGPEDVPDVPEADCSVLEVMTCLQTPECSWDVGCCSTPSPPRCVPAGTPLYGPGCPDAPCLPCDVLDEAQCRDYYYCQAGYCQEGSSAPTYVGCSYQGTPAPCPTDGGAGDLGDGPDVMTGDAAGGG
jgi:hypothetical protein